MRVVENFKPLVSVLITAYNQEKYIAKALDSILMQECPFDYEILVGEDCSTDQTRYICLEYAKNHPDKIRLFLNKENKGLVNNYFDLLEHARGIYLADCGGDDYWLTRDRLRRQVEILTGNPEVSLVYGNWQMFDQESGLLQTDRAGMSEDWFIPEYYGPETVKNYLNIRNIPRVVLSTACFRGDWIKESIQEKQDLFRGKQVVCEDLPITLVLLMKGPFYLMKEELMVYRVLNKSVSHSERIGDNLKGFSYKVFLQTLDLAFGLGLSAKEIMPYINKALPDLIFYAFFSKDRKWMNIIVKDLSDRNIRLNLKQMVMYTCTLNDVAHWFIFNIYCLLKSKRQKKCTK